MANQALTLDRRNFLATGTAASIAVVAVAGPAIASAICPATAWKNAMNAFKQRRAKEVAFDNAVWRPAYAINQAGGQAVSKSIDAEMERLTDLRCEAGDALLSTPAPDMRAVIWKLDYIHEMEDDYNGIHSVWWESAMSDPT